MFQSFSPFSTQSPFGSFAPSPFGASSSPVPASSSPSSGGPMALPQFNFGAPIPRTEGTVKSPFAPVAGRGEMPKADLWSQLPVETSAFLPSHLIKSVPVVLQDRQKPMAEFAIEVLKRNHGVWNTAPPRAGKTPWTCYVAQQFDFAIGSVSPLTVCPVWEKHTTEYGVPVAFNLNYEKLVGKEPKRTAANNYLPVGTQYLRNGLLIRHDAITDGGLHKTWYTVTEEYLALLQRGILLVFDEAHRIKNDSLQSRACAALMKPIISQGGISRYVLLTATPFDKVKHSIQMLRMTGYIRFPNLYYKDPQTKAIVLQGMQELIDACRFIDAPTTDAILSQTLLVNRDAIDQAAYDLLINVIKYQISGGMPPAVTGKRDEKNGFYHVSPERLGPLRQAVSDLKEAARFNPNTGTVDIQHADFGAITNALVAIEECKTPDIFARIAKGYLDAHPLQKVILVVNYTSTIETLQKLLVGYFPVVLNGSVKGDKRGPIIEDFRTRMHHRVMLANTKVLKEGISTYMKIAGANVVTIISPNYSVIDQAQVAARGDDLDWNTISTVRIAYCSDPSAQETGILHALAVKTQVIKGLISYPITLPGDYTSELEPSVFTPSFFAQPEMPIIPSAEASPAAVSPGIPSAEPVPMIQVNPFLAASQ